MTFTVRVAGGTGAGKRKVKTPVRCGCGGVMLLRQPAKTRECVRCGQGRDGA